MDRVSQAYSYGLHGFMRVKSVVIPRSAIGSDAAQIGTSFRLAKDFFAAMLGPATSALKLMGPVSPSDAAFKENPP
jgi:hypothetical protein